MRNAAEFRWGRRIRFAALSDHSAGFEEFHLKQGEQGVTAAVLCAIEISNHLNQIGV